MSQNQSTPLESISYFFTRSKDVYEENGTLFITLFARLTREFTTTSETSIVKKIESVWVNIDEMKIEHASPKIRALPDRIYQYEVSKEVFLGLFVDSVKCPTEIYFVTPLSMLKVA